MFNTYLRNVWVGLQESYWLVPGLMAVLAIVLAAFTLALDERLDISVLTGFGWTFIRDPAGARDMLSTIAQSMITVGGVVFSSTLVVLALGGGQFGSRLVRSFRRDKGNQLVLGTFIGTFIFCLLVLRRVDGREGEVFIPYLSVTCGLLLALLSLALFIYFIHHVAASAQADNVVAVVGAELDRTIARLFRDQLEAAPGRDRSPALPEDFLGQSAAVLARRDGYIQAIDFDRLVEQAVTHDLIIALQHRPGQFVVCATPLARCWPGSQVDAPLENAVSAAIILGVQPTPEQDINFSIQQMVQVAVRALSPGVNDPFTAMTCIDHLSAALAELLRREFPAACRYDGEGRLRLVVPALTFSAMIDDAFDQIRRYGRADAALTRYLLDALAMLAPLARRKEDRAAVLRHAELVVQSAREHLPEAQDREALVERHRELLGVLEEEDRIRSRS